MTQYSANSVHNHLLIAEVIPKLKYYNHASIHRGREYKFEVKGILCCIYLRPVDICPVDVHWTNEATRPWEKAG